MRDGSITGSDLLTVAGVDVLQELYDNLEKQRPNLFRLASNADDKDNDGISKSRIIAR